MDYRYLRSRLLCRKYALFGLVIVSMIELRVSSYSCPVGWNLQNDQCYFVSNIINPVNFYDASALCSYQNAVLASVPNVEVYNYLWNLVNQSWSSGSCPAGVIQSCQTSPSTGTCATPGCLQFWIGLYKYNPNCFSCAPGDAATRQGWRWLINNSTYDWTSGWNNWAVTEPNQNVHCARLGVQDQSMIGYFADQDCGVAYNYICQKRPTDAVLTTQHQYSNPDTSTVSTPSISSSTHSNDTGTSPTSQSSSLGLIIGPAVAVPVGVLLIVIIVVIFIIVVKRRKGDRNTCNFKNCFANRKAPAPDRQEWTGAKSLKPCSRETLRGNIDRIIIDQDADMYDSIDSIDPYSTTSTRLGENNDKPVNPYQTVSEAASDDISTIHPYSVHSPNMQADFISDYGSIAPYAVHSPQPNTNPGFVSDYASSESTMSASIAPVYSVPEKTKEKSLMAGLLGRFQKRFSTASQEVYSSPVYSVPNKPPNTDNPMNV